MTRNFSIVIPTIKLTNRNNVLPSIGYPAHGAITPTLTAMGAISINATICHERILLSQKTSTAVPLSTRIIVLIATNKSTRYSPFF